MSYGYVNTEELEQKGGSGLSAGLNRATVVSFAYNPNGGAGGAAQDCIDVEIAVEGREKPLNKRYFPITRVFDKNNTEITDVNNPEFEVAVQQLNGTLIDIVSAVAGQDTVKAALARPINSFKEFAEVLTNVYKATPGADTVPVDIFLSYEWKIRGENKTTFLVLPDAKSIKHGRWIIPAVNGVFTKEITPKGLRYVTAEGIPHPFTRTDWFVKSAFFNVTRLEGASDNEETAAEQPAGEGW